MPAVSTESRRFYRNRISNLLVWLIVAFCADVFLVGLAGDLRSGRAGVILDLVALAPCLFLLVRIPRHGVMADEHGVTVRNVWRTHVLAWSEIERFEAGSYPPWPRAGIAVLRDGTRVPIVGIQRGILGKLTENTVAALNQRLAAMTRGAPGTLIAG